MSSQNQKHEVLILLEKQEKLLNELKAKMNVIIAELARRVEALERERRTAARPQKK